MGKSEAEIKQNTKSWHTILAKYFKGEKDYDRKAEVKDTFCDARTYFYIQSFICEP